MKAFFTELFNYNLHCNQQVANHFLAHPTQTTEKSTKLFSHVLNAHQIWINRITQNPNSFGVWDVHATEALKTIDSENFAQTLRLLEHVDLNTTVTYTNSKNHTFTNTVRDILFHIINHSTYHRAQIASDFKQHNLETLATDYIFYKR